MIHDVWKQALLVDSISGCFRRRRRCQMCLRVDLVEVARVTTDRVIVEEVGERMGALTVSFKLWIFRASSLWGVC